MKDLQKMPWADRRNYDLHSKLVTEIHCRFCCGDGKNHHHMASDPREYCPCCYGTGKSSEPYDLPRNGSTVGYDPKIGLQATFPHLRNLTQIGGGYFEPRSGHIIGVLIEFDNRDYPERLERFKRGELYKTPYYEEKNAHN